MPGDRTVLHLHVRGVDRYQRWLDALKDVRARAEISRRIDRVEEGNFGDHRSVGGGVWELRIDVGPGYRVYYGLDGPTVVVLIGGGAKPKQGADIARARSLWKSCRRSL